MDTNSNDKGIISVLLPRLEKQRLPKAMALRDKVNKGERLGEYDMAFLEEVFVDANKAMTLVKNNPEYESLAARMIALYHEITTQALKNEQGSSD